MTDWLPDEPTVPSHLVDDIDLGAIRLFLAAAELGSVAKAATRVGIAQPSASAKLRKLERLLGVPLLQRRATGSTLTEGGDAVAVAASNLLVAATSLLREAERGRDGDQRLRLAATRSIIDYRFDDLVGRAGFDDVVIDVTALDTRGVAQAVRSGRVGVGMLDGPFAPLGLRSVVVGRFETVAVVAPSHPLARRGAIDPAELVAERLIVRRDGSGTRDVVEAALAPFGFGSSGRRVEVSSNAGALATARTGSGIAFVPRELAHADLAAGSLAELSVAGVDLSQPIRLCWSGHAPARRLAADLVAALT